MRIVVLILIGFIFSVGAHGVVYSPRVLSPHNADAYSMKTFAQFHRWRDLKGDAKVYEIFKYLADPRTGLYPLGVPGWEGAEEMSEYGAVRDPVKMINVYPMSFCGTLGPTMAGIIEGMGIGPGRTLVIPGWQHVAAEVFYGGRWHYLDLDVRAAFRREDGSLASMEEAKRDPSLWNQPNGPLFFPLDALNDVQKAYARTTVDHYYAYYSGGHTMDFLLRQGETFTRWWKPQGGRWNHHPSYAQKPFPRNVIEREPRGPKCKHTSFTVHTHGNGRVIYSPNLTRTSSDFEDGVYDFRNVQPGADGLTLKEPGDGYAIFEVRTPYVIVPVVGDLDTTADDREASLVEIDAVGAALSLSLDNGLTWRELGVASGTLDLTRHVAGTYGYLLKIALRGEPDKAVVRSLEITTWVQVHPASLPSLRKGGNGMRYVTGDHYGLQTRVIEIRSNAGKPDEFLKYLVEPPRDYDPARHTSRVRGAVTARVQAPPNARIAWFSAGAGFSTYQGEAAKNTRNSIAYAVNAPSDFREIYGAEVPTDQNHWHYNADQEVRLEEPARIVCVRYVGDPAVNNIRIYAHCLDDRRRRSRPVVITHVWTENGTRKIRTVSLDEPSGYDITAESDPTDESVEISVPGDALERARPDAARSAESKEEAWAATMRNVHARFKGAKGTFAQFGDSITVSRAFWFTLQHARKNAPPQMEKDFQLVNQYMLKDCWDWKGAEFGNQGQMTVRWAHENVDAWLKELNPEAAVIMFGTNDLDQLDLEEYEAKTRHVVQRCLDNGTVVILSTIPPRTGRAEKAAEFAEAVRRVARDLKVPLTDYHAEILKRRPNDWDGAMEKFSEYEGYDVPTLISRDGVHPSNPGKYNGDYSEEGLRSNGYCLRNYLVLTKYAEVIRSVLKN